MASRKKVQPDTQASLFAAPVATPTIEDPVVLAPPPDALDRPKLRLVPPPEKLLESDVIVEKVGDNVYEVTLLRDHGTTVAAVFYTKKQLEQLIKRAQGALEIG